MKRKVEKFWCEGWLKFSFFIFFIFDFLKAWPNQKNNRQVFYRVIKSSLYNFLKILYYPFRAMLNLWYGLENFVLFFIFKDRLVLEYVHLLLKNTRLNQGIGTDKVAFDLCLTERQIHSIENNLKDFFYSPELKLVSIKKYARYLGLDENVVIYQEENLSKTSNETHEAVTEISMSEEVVNDKLDDVVTVSSNATKNIKQNKLYRDDLVRHPIIILGVDYIKNHLTHKITLTDLVRETGYSERSIQLIFNKHFNLSPYEYIEEERLLRAKALIQLHKQNRKIADIAQDAGLMHLGRFSVNFKRRFGLSPSELAKS